MYHITQKQRAVRVRCDLMHTCISGRESGTFSRNGWEDSMSDGAGASRVVGWIAAGDVD